MRNGTQLICKTVGMIGTNCYILLNKDLGEAVIIDPGDEAERLIRAVEDLHCRIEMILLTHGHGDHILAVRELCEYDHGIRVGAGWKEQEMLEDPSINQAILGISYTVKPDLYFHDNEMVYCAGFAFRVIETPGHSPGSVCFYEAEEGLLFSGDTLFKGSFGRTDFPGGSAKELFDSLKRLRDEIPDEVRILPGHMEETTMQWEKQYNPAL